MRIHITECYTEPGASYDFSWGAKEWILKELKRRIGPSKSFRHAYSKDYQVALWLDAHSKGSEPTLSGPVNRRRDKTVEFFVSIPHPRRKAKWPRDYAQALKHLLDSAVMVFQKLDIDVSRVVADSAALIRRFTAMSESKMIKKDWDDDSESESPADSQAAGASQSKLKAKAPLNANELIKTAGLENRLKHLQGRHEVRFTKAFDTGESRAAKSWKSNYAVLDLVAVLPAKASGIPDALYLEALEVFKAAHQALGRARTFFCLRLVPRLKGPSWSLELFLQDRDLLKTHALVLEAAKPIAELMLKNAEFRKSCSDGPHLLVAYSERDKRIIGFQSQLPVTFDQAYSQGTKVEQEIMSDNCGRNIAGMSGVFLGNVACARDDYRAASEHWRRAADAGVKDAPFCVAVASVQLGDMEQAFEFCKRAIQVGDPPSRLNDPELAEFRRHPLFAKLKEWIAARRGSRPRMAKPVVPLPKWTVPKSIGRLVKEEGGMWENERFDPILLSVMSDTSYQGRDIPLAWQIEFDPSDERLETANEKIQASGIEPDGDGWSEVIQKGFAKQHPKLAKELHSDSESSTCVIWVESEGACRKLIEIVWELLHLASIASA